jgi:hypothetical protein
MTKDVVINTLKEFPESFTIDELIEKLIFKQKIQTGLDQSKNENVVSTDSAKEQLKQWLS